MWILAIDVRDGQRIAFPQWMSGVSFDVKSHGEKARKTLQRLEAQRPLLVERALLSLQLDIQEHVSQGDLPDYNFDEVKSLAEMHREPIDLDTKRQLADKIRLLKKEMAAEAIIFFNGQSWPVRSLSATTSWDHMTAWTGKTEEISTSDDDMPNFDNVHDPNS